MMHKIALVPKHTVAAAAAAQRGFSAAASKFTPSPELLNRIRYTPARSQTSTPDEAAKGLFHDGNLVALSGFTGVGYPKEIPAAVLRAVAASKNPPPRLSLLTGASTGVALEDGWAQAGMMAFRSPYQSAPKLTQGINLGRTMFSDQHLSKFCHNWSDGQWAQPISDASMNLRYGDPAVTGRAWPQRRTDGRIDVAVVEATAINAEGEVILGPAGGATPEMLASADNIIIEVNTSLPDMTGFHDMITGSAQQRFYTQPIMLTGVNQRIGSEGVRVDWSKVRGVVETKVVDDVAASGISGDDVVSRSIAAHMLAFFEHEVSRGRLPPSLPPLQSGIGNVANAVVAGLAECRFTDMEVWSEVVQDAFIPLILNGKVKKASTASLRLSSDMMKTFIKDLDLFKNKLVIRPQAMSNSPELIHRLGVVAMNTPLEVDIYAHANSTNALGSKMIHGIGGSGDFMRHARLSVMHTPSVRKSPNGALDGISCLVPFATHIDHTEHDIDVIVTEQGLADVRGLAPRERARLIIEKCAHPTYKQQLMDYLTIAEAQCEKSKSMHQPHVINCAFQMHRNLQLYGDMKIKKWDA